MKKTPNLNLNKPEEDDFYDINHFNENSDVIDENFASRIQEIKELQELINTKVSELTVWTNTELSKKSNTAHSHNATEITAGTLGIARLPTGTTASTVCLGNDSRLSNARTPTSHTHAWSEVTSQPALNTANLTTVTQAIAQAGTDTTVRAWTAQRVRQAAEAAVVETGAFTPTFGGVTTDPTASASTVGTYSRTGKNVTISVRYSGTLTGGSGQLLLRGLPFTPRNTVVSSELQTTATSPLAGAKFSSTSGGSWGASRTYLGANIRGQDVTLPITGNLGVIYFSMTYEIQ